MESKKIKLWLFVKVFTFILGPSAPPQFVRAVTKSMHSIGVTWQEVPASDRSGFNIVNYTVTYYPATQPKKRKSTPMRFVNLTHLLMNTNYTISVQAYNEKGNGPASVPIYVTTSDGSKSVLLPTYTVNTRYSGHARGFVL